MDPHLNPSHAYSGGPFPGTATPTAQPLQLFQPTNQQLLWLQQQQGLREQQAAVLQMFYAQQARGLGFNMGPHERNTTMLSNPCPTIPRPFTYGFPPVQDGRRLTSSPPLSSASFQYAMFQNLLQPPLALQSFPTMNPSNTNPSSITERESSSYASDFNSSSVAGGQATSVSTPAMSEFTAVDDLILVNALHEHGTIRSAACALAGTRNHSRSEWQAYYASKRDIIDKFVGDVYFSADVKERETNATNHVSIPGIPTKEPTPSKKLVSCGGGNRYTDEDDEYFTQYILWSFSQDFESPKAALCNDLSLKAPHHSLESWKTYWWSRERDIERVRQLFKNKTPPEGLVSFKVTMRPSRSRSSRLDTPSIRRTNSRDSHSQKNKADTVEPAVSDCDLDSSADDQSNSNTSEKVQLGHTAETRLSTYQNPISYSKADMQAVVKHMVEYPNLSPGARWQALSKIRPAHTSKAWGEYYRRNRVVIDRKAGRLARRYAKEDVSSAHGPVVLEGAQSNETPTHAKLDMKRFESSEANQPVEESQLPSTSQSIVGQQLHNNRSQSQLQPQLEDHLIGFSDLRHARGSTYEAQPTATMPYNQFQPLPVSRVTRSHSHELQTPYHPLESRHLKESQREPSDGRTVKQERRPSTSLSAAQWPSETEIGSEAHARESCAATSPLSSLTSNPNTDQSESALTYPIVPKAWTLDPRMTAEQALLAAVKRKAAEEVILRETKRRTK